MLTHFKKMTLYFFSRMEQGKSILSSWGHLAWKNMSKYPEVWFSSSKSYLWCLEEVTEPIVLEEVTKPIAHTSCSFQDSQSRCQGPCKWKAMSYWLPALISACLQWQSSIPTPCRHCGLGVHILADQWRPQTHHGINCVTWKPNF